MLSFVPTVTYCTTQNQDRSTTIPQPAISRRTASQIILLSAVSVLPYPTKTMAEQTQRGPTSKNEAKKKFFAEVMENSMLEYEENIASVKNKLLIELKPGDKIVDIGLGTGPNLQYMPKDAQVIGVEPNEFMWPYARKKAERFNVNLRLINGTGENIPLEDDSCDAVLTTLVMCSVPDPKKTIQEVLRVLKPGGIHIFIEHVIASSHRPILRTMQKLLNPLQKFAADGCHVNRDTGSVLRSFEGHGYSMVEYDAFNLDFSGRFGKVSLISSHIAGYARKA